MDRDMTQMGSRLADLKYELASAGYSSEQIHAVEQDITDMALAFGTDPELIAGDLLSELYAMHSFQQSTTQIVTHAPTSWEMCSDLSRLVEETAMPYLPEPHVVQPTEKTPYYHKNKQKWWK